VGTVVVSGDNLAGGVEQLDVGVDGELVAWNIRVGYHVELARGERDEMRRLLRR
jgi:hypothetical protein